MAYENYDPDTYSVHFIEHFGNQMHFRSKLGGKNNLVTNLSGAVTCLKSSQENWSLKEMMRQPLVNSACPFPPLTRSALEKQCNLASALPKTGIFESLVIS